MTEFATDRRSIGDLSDVLPSLFPAEGSVFIKDLPTLITNLEKEKAREIFSVYEKGAFDDLAASMPEFPVTQDQLLGLLMQIMAAAPDSSNKQGEDDDASSTTSAASELPQPTTPNSESVVDSDPPTPASSMSSIAGAPPPPSAPPVRQTHRRRVSDRIRSASDSSSSSSDEGSKQRTVKCRVPSGEQRGSLDFPGSTFGDFVASGSASSSSSTSVEAPSQIPVRNKTLSQTSSDGSVAATAGGGGISRVRATVADAASGGGGDKIKPPSSWERFQRPEAPSRERRRRSRGGSSVGGTSEAGSENEAAAATMGTTRSDNIFTIPSTPTKGLGGQKQYIRARKTSQPVVISPSRGGGGPGALGGAGAAGRTMSDDSLYQQRAESFAVRAASPTIDERSFYSISGLIRGSPTGGDDDSDFAHMQREVMLFPSMGGHGRESSIGVDGAEGAGEASEGGMRTNRGSSASIRSLSSFHDRITELEKVNAELTRKLQAAQLDLEQTATDSERFAADYTDQIEELKMELSAKRREEKELRGKERGYLSQIQTFEADVAKFHKTIETSKATYSTLLKNYTEQCSVSEDLRNTIRAKDLDLRSEQETIDNLKGDVEKWTRDIKLIEEANALLAQDLATARQAETFLEEQKMENLLLKETINRLRGDLDELRTLSGGSDKGGSVSRSGSVRLREGSTAGGSSNLSNEIARVKMEEQAPEDDLGESSADNRSAEEEQPGEDYVEEYITTTRRKRILIHPGEIPTVVVRQEDIKEYADAFVQATPEPKHSMGMSTQTDESSMANLPAYTPRPEDSLSPSKGSSATLSDDETMISSRRSSWNSRRQSGGSESLVKNFFDSLRSLAPDADDDKGLVPRHPLQRYAPFIVGVVALSFIIGWYAASPNSSGLDPLELRLAADRAIWSAYNSLAGSPIGAVFADPAAAEWGATATLAGNKIRRLP